MAEWVYIIEAKGQNLFKVGFTAGEPVDRLYNLQTASPHELDLLIAFSNADGRLMERMLHVVLEKRRTVGEWFSCPREEMLDAIMHLFAGALSHHGIMQIRSSSLQCS